MLFEERICLRYKVLKFLVLFFYCSSVLLHSIKKPWCHDHDFYRVFVVHFFQNTRVLFNVRVVGGSAFYSYLSPQDGQPLYHPAVDRWGFWKYINSSFWWRVDVTHMSTFMRNVLIDICPPSQELIIHLKGISSLLLGFALHSLGGVDCTPAESWKPVRPNKSVWPLMQQKLFNALMLVCLTGIFLDTFLE